MCAHHYVLLRLARSHQAHLGSGVLGEYWTPSRIVTGAVILSCCAAARWGCMSREIPIQMHAILYWSDVRLSDRHALPDHAEQLLPHVWLCRGVDR